MLQYKIKIFFKHFGWLAGSPTWRLQWRLFFCLLFLPRLACYHFSSAQFSRSVVSNSLRPCGPQHTRPPCPSRSLLIKHGVYWEVNSRPSTEYTARQSAGGGSTNAGDKTPVHRTSLVVQWLGIHPLVQGMQVWSLAGELDPKWHGATKPIHHNKRSCKPKLRPNAAKK